MKIFFKGKFDHILLGFTMPVYCALRALSCPKMVTSVITAAPVWPRLQNDQRLVNIIVIPEPVVINSAEQLTIHCNGTD